MSGSGESWASSIGARRTMVANRPVDTGPERSVRSALHRRGFRFRKNLSIRVGSTQTRPDIVFTTARVAVYVDGCFWHCCPEHATRPKSNAQFWDRKLRDNVKRDRRVDRALTQAGWAVLRVWEHEEPESAVESIVDLLNVRH